MSYKRVKMTCPDCKKYFYRYETRVNDHPYCTKCKSNHPENPLTKKGWTVESERKKRETTIQRYGVENVSQFKEFKDKEIQSKLHKYGFANGFSDPNVQQKAITLAKDKKSKDKKLNTFMEHYGVSHAMKHPSVKNKPYETYKSRTGYDHPLKNPEVKNKMVKEFGQIGRVRGYCYQGIHFDSSWELAVYIWLTDHNKKFLYHPPIPFKYIGDDNKEHEGYPDFLIEGKFYELKGTQFFNENHEPFNKYTQKFWWGKFQAMKENNITIWELKDIKPYLEYIKTTYGTDFLRGFKEV